MLKENRCYEEAHRQLIHIYIVQGRRSEAIGQYQSCERILAEGLGVPPMTETIATIRGILTWDQSVPTGAEANDHAVGMVAMPLMVRRRSYKSVVGSAIKPSASVT